MVATHDFGASQQFTLFLRAAMFPMRKLQKTCFQQGNHVLCGLQRINSDRYLVIMDGDGGGVIVIAGEVLL